MQLLHTVFVCATLIAATVAQATPTTTSLHFTAIPTSLVAGVKQTIGWAGGNGNGVNIILQQGLASNLQNVPILPIASGAEGNSTTWTPPKSLPDAGNYALRIEQGDAVNYSGMLQLFGGCSTCPTNAAAALASTSASASSPGSATASSTSSTASSSSKSGVGAPIVSSGSEPSSNSTGPTGSASNSTTTSSSMNSTMSTGKTTNVTISGINSTANSTANSTFSSATLHAASTKSSSSSPSTSSSISSSSSSESTSSSTGSSTSPSETNQSGGVTVAASKFALLLCAIIGVIYLG